MEKGMEEGIEVLVQCMIEDKRTEEEIVMKLEDSFGLDKKKAEEYYERFSPFVHN